MDVLYPRCAGLDLGKDALVACVRIHGRPVQQDVRTFGTTTRELLALAAWLTEYGVTHVAMEATGTYWKSVWHILEEDVTLVLGNAGHIRNVPGHKSDVKDAEWIADLLAHGLIRGSFVPPAPIQEVRDLTRTRKQLVREIAQHTRRIQKTLDIANLKMTGVISNVLGVSGRATLRALIAGQTDPVQLADLARGTLKNKRAALVEALTGRVTAHHRRLLKLHLELIERLETAVEEVDAQLGDALAPFHDAVERVDGIPGYGGGPSDPRGNRPRHVALPHASAADFVGLSVPPPGRACWQTEVHPHPERRLLAQDRAHSGRMAAVRTKNTYYRAQFLRLRARRGPKKAIVAVAASMLTAIYYILRDGVRYRELGGQYIERLDRRKVTQRLVKRLQDLGYQVQLEDGAA